MSVLAICPSRGRPDRAAECLRSFEETRRDPSSRLVFVVDRDDPTRRQYPGDVYLARPTGSYVGAINAAAKDRTVVKEATAIGFVGDDVRFVTPGWDVTLGTWLTDNIGIAWGDDGWDHPWPKEDKASHWWVSRPIVDVFGLAPAGLRHFYPDDFWAQLGWAAGCAKYFPDVLIEHLHPMAKKANSDPTYRRPRRFVASDRAWWEHWQSHGKAGDVARLRGITGRERPASVRRVLADWHHPALWESLRILFEERFGWELYSPIGLDWQSHGWRFQHNGWGPAAYLVYPDAQLVVDHYELVEPEYPEHPRKLVTVEQAHAMRWDYVLSSVVPHQQSFSRLARRFGARYIHQVGNARHPVDRSLRAVVLASATVERTVRAIRYHQEFDRRIFARAPLPDDGLSVASLMLRLDSTSCDYAWLAGASGVRWTAVTAEHPRAPGYLAPMTKVADRIRRSGWVWHDKKIGDGYGHAMFTAAAMGRPLIGHASHFKGMAGEPFWRDLETCIDLDRHPPERALRLLRAISADRDWHGSMSDAIAGVFDSTVDFDAEAERIRDALA